MATKGGALVNLQVNIGTGGYVAATRTMIKSDDKMINSLRWLGRDLMRIGSEIDKVSDKMAKGWEYLTKESTALAGGLGDINWAFGDIAEILGESVAPWFDRVADSLDWLIDLVDKMPDIFKQGIVVILMVIPLLVKMFGLFLKLSGGFSILAGSLMALRKEGGLVKGSLKLLKIALGNLTGGAGASAFALIKEKAALADDLAELKRYKSALQDAQKGTAEGTVEHKAYTAELKKVDSQTKGLENDLLMTNVKLKALGKEEKKDTKVSGGFISKIKGLAKGLKENKKGLATLGTGLLALGATIGITAIATAGLGPIMEALDPVMASLSDSIQPIADAIAPLADQFAAWMDSLGSFSSVIGVAAIAIGILGAAIMGAFGATVATAVIGALTSIGGAIAGAVSSVAAGSAGIMVAMGPIGWILLAITAAVALFALAWSQNWGDIQGKFADAGAFISKGWTDLVVALGNAWDGFTKWIKSGIDAIVKFFQPLIDVINWFLKALGLGGPGGMAGANQININGVTVTVSGEVPPGLADALAHIPGAQGGGLIARGGLAYVHPAEVIVPAAGGQGAGIAQNNYFTISITGTTDRDLNTLADRISNILRAKLNALAGGGI